MMVAGYILLTLAALMLAGWASPARGWRLWFALLALGWVTGQLNTLIEAVAFGVMPLRDVTVQWAISLVALALLTALGVTLLGKWRGERTPAVRLNLGIAMLAGVILVYELLYFGAGTLVWPFVADFYADKTVPAFTTVAALQVPRALIFFAAAWPWLRTGPRHAGWVLGTVFAVVAGVAPMLPDNPYMPSDVRFAHGIETSVSNFLFGVAMVWLLRSRLPVVAVHA